MSANEQVTLGGHELDVYAQRHAYLTNKVSGFFKELVESNIEINDAASVINLLGDRAYDLLCVVIPQYGKRCPKYEFMGYASQEAYEAGNYNEREDQSPSFPEMVNAFEVATRVNRFDVIKVLGNVFDPKLLRAWINSQVAETLSNASAKSLAPEAGSGTSMTSGATSPTSTQNGDSHSPVSDPSSTPVTVGE